jgi:hypothetical protein
MQGYQLYRVINEDTLHRLLWACGPDAEERLSDAPTSADPRTDGGRFRRCCCPVARSQINASGRIGREQGRVVGDEEELGE